MLDARLLDGIDLNSDTNGVDGLITQRALNALVRPETFSVLFGAMHQAFGTLVIYRGGLMGGVPSLVECPVRERGRYAEHFRNMRQMQRRSGENSVPGTALQLSVMLSFDAGSGKPVGYIPFARYVHPGKLGDEVLFVVFCAQLGTVVLFVAPDAGCEDRVQRMVGPICYTLPLSKVCSLCGKVEPRMRKCPCGLSRYCGGACQKAHWPCHKEACTHPR
jgi:hypothetical protein